MLNTPFSPWPSYTEDECTAVSRVLASNRVNYWTGNECLEFEREFAAWAECGYAVALANGTVALETALKVLGVGRGDEVVVTPRTFIASASCVVSAGARPVFADVDADSQNISAASIRRALTPRTRAVICVHLAGWPCEMEEIMALAEERGIFVVEDCAQAHGARYKGRSAGSLGHVAAWSFCQDKIMTTGGEGGMLTTNSRDLWSAAWSFKDHGKSWSAVHEREASPGFSWVHESFGVNGRMIEMQAAIGRIQLRRMPDWHCQRAANAAALTNAMAACPALRVPVPRAEIEHAWYKCYAFVRTELLGEGWNRDRIIREIVGAGVPCYSGSCSEVYLEGAFRHSGLAPLERLPVARLLGDTSLAFLVHPTLTVSEIDKTSRTICDVMARATGRS